MLVNKYWIIPIVSLLMSISLSASGEILFEENFEQDTIGKEPSNFELIECTVNRAEAMIEVVEDPEGRSDKVAKITSFALYVLKAAERDDWTDWYWEWDWRWDTAGNPGNAYRIEDSSNWFHFSPRSDGVSLQLYQYNGNWNLMTQVQFPLELNRWYRFQQIMQGEQHIVKIKERDDDTPFDEIEPAIEHEDGTYQKGAVGGLGTDAGSTWVDNFILYEEPKDILAVDLNDELAVTWGKLKVQ